MKIKKIIFLIMYLLSFHTFGFTSKFQNSESIDLNLSISDDNKILTSNLINHSNNNFDCKFGFNLGFIDNNGFEKKISSVKYNNLIILGKQKLNLEIFFNNFKLSNKNIIGFSEFKKDKFEELSCKEVQLTDFSIKLGIQTALKNNHFNLASELYFLLKDKRKFKFLDLSSSQFNLSENIENEFSLNFVEKNNTSFLYNLSNLENSVCENRKSNICGYIYFNEQSSSCPVKEYNLGNSSACPFSHYISARSPACGVEIYNKCQSDKCGWKVPPAGGGRNHSPGVRKSCRVKECGVELYNECMHPNHGSIYLACRHQNHGVASYKSCRHPNHEIENVKSCKLLVNLKNGEYEKCE